MNSSDDSTGLAAHRVAEYVTEQFGVVFLALEHVKPAVVELVEEAFDREATLLSSELRALEHAFTDALRGCDRMVRGLSFSSDRESSPTSRTRSRTGFVDRTAGSSNDFC